MTGCLFFWWVFLLTLSQSWGGYSLEEMALQERSDVLKTKISILLPTPFFPKKGISQTAQKKPLQTQGVPARPKHLTCSSQGNLLLCSWALQNYPFLSYSQKLWQERAQSVSLQMRFLRSNELLFKMMESMKNL